MQNSMMEIGGTARDFTLKDHQENDFTLNQYKGKKILLSFHPLAWTSICAQQMKSLEDHQDSFRSANTIPVGISIDSVPSKKAWAEHLGIQETCLLSDFWPHGKVATSYGLFREKEGFSERANVIIDENQKIIFVKVYPLSTLPDIKEIIRFIKK